MCTMTPSYVCNETHLYAWHDASKRALWVLRRCDVTHSYVCGVIRSSMCHSFVCVTWLICTRDMTPAYVWRDAFICVTCRIHICDVTPAYVAWLFDMCDVTRSWVCAIILSYVWHDLFLCAPGLLHMCDVTNIHAMTPWYVWRDIFTRVTWLLMRCSATHSYLCHDSSIGVKQPGIRVLPWPLHMSNVTRWLVRTCGMTPYICDVTRFVYSTWLLHMCDVSHRMRTMMASYVWYD